MKSVPRSPIQPYEWTTLTCTLDILQNLDIIIVLLPVLRFSPLGSLYFTLSAYTTPIFSDQ